jgi:SAM-dependent methyltransferase
MKFMNPRYTDTHLAAYYANYTRESEWSADQRLFLQVQKREHVRLVERHIAPGKFLSIGTGSGEEIEAAIAGGWIVEGYDVDPATCARVALRLGVTVHSGDLFALPLKDESYDCVYLDQVLEHVKEPAQYLRLCHRLLRPGGVLYLGVPNIASVSSMWQTFAGRVGLKKRRGRHYDSEHHLNYFSPGTLPRTLTRLFGFRVERVEGDPRPNLRGSRWHSISSALERRFPTLDSSLLVIARRT